MVIVVVVHNPITGLFFFNLPQVADEDSNDDHDDDDDDALVCNFRRRLISRLTGGNFKEPVPFQLLLHLGLSVGVLMKN